MAKFDFNELKKERFSVVLDQGKRRHRIKAILGDNFVALKQEGGKLEVITKAEMTSEVRTRIERIWRSEE